MPRATNRIHKNCAAIEPANDGKADTIRVPWAAGLCPWLSSGAPRLRHPAPRQEPGSLLEPASASAGRSA